MGNLLTSKSKGSKRVNVTAIDKAILDLKLARKGLLDQKKRQEMLSERALATVQQLLRSQKPDRALVALRKRKLHEQQVLQVESHILRIDEQLVSVETTSQQATLLDALKTANVAIKEMQKQMKVEDVEKLMDESADATQYLEEVQAVLGHSLVGQEKDDLEAELNDMADKMEAQQVAELPRPEQNPPDWQPSQVEKPVAGTSVAEAAVSKVASTSAVQAATEDEPLPDVPSHSAAVEGDLSLPNAPTHRVEPQHSAHDAKELIPAT